MGRLIAVIALAGAAAFAAHPGSSPRAHNAVPTVTAAAATPAAVEAAIDEAERDFATRQAEVGLVGSAPLFGAEGLPKPIK